MLAARFANCTQAYMQAFTDLVDVETRAAEMAALMSDAADMMCFDPTLIVAAEADGLGLTEATWPSFQQVRALIFEYETARSVLHAEWQKLDTVYRVGLPPPPRPRNNVTLAAFV